MNKLGLIIGALWIFMGGWGVGGTVSGHFPVLAGVLSLALVTGGGVLIWFRVKD